MKIILLGNAGAGKTTLARKLMAQERAAHLTLDKVAFRDGAERRPLAESIAAALDFIMANRSWVIEGCYADIMEPLLEHCDRLIFLNPGVDTCIAHCRQRPFEPDKYQSREAQDRNLENLLEWVRGYKQREDEYGLQRHRALYEGFAGDKQELNTPGEYQDKLAG